MVIEYMDLFLYQKTTKEARTWQFGKEETVEMERQFWDVVAFSIS